MNTIQKELLKTQWIYILVATEIASINMLPLIQRHRKPLALLLIISLGSFVAALLLLIPARTNQTTADVGVLDYSMPKSSEIQSPGDREIKATETTLDNPQDDPTPFSPSQVFADIECRMSTGRGEASGIALISLPHGEDFGFAVIDANGVIFDGVLPFQPHNFDLGRRPDGSVLVGVADLRRNSGIFRPGDTDEPLRIFHDGQIVYETQKAWEFDIASNGTSFVVHEPTSGGASRLMIQNLDRGTEDQVDLGSRYSKTNEYDSGILLRYSLDETEVALVSSREDSRGKGDYWFYSIKDGSSRQISVKHGLSALLTSSENGYFVEKPLDLEPDRHSDFWQISRRELYEDESKNKDIWTAKVSLGTFFGSMKLSGDGKWLALNGWNFKVLNTETGETVFRFPKTGDKPSRLARSLSVLGPNATEEDLGRLGPIQFVGNNLMFHQEYGSLSECSGNPSGEWDRTAYLECVDNQRNLGRYDTVADVFNMENIRINSQPDYRVKTNQRGRCSKRKSLLVGGLDEIEGKLVYLPEIPPDQ